MVWTPNYAINPTPELDLRSNRALLPARVIAALGLMMPNSWYRNLVLVLVLATLSSCASYSAKSSYESVKIGCEPKQCLTQLATSGVEEVLATNVAPFATKPSELPRFAGETVIIVNPGLPRFELDGDRIVSRIVGAAVPFAEQLEKVETRTELINVLSKFVSRKYVVYGLREQFQIDLSHGVSDEAIRMAVSCNLWKVVHQNGGRTEHVNLMFGKNGLAKIEQANWYKWYPEL